MGRFARLVSGLPNDLRRIPARLEEADRVARGGRALPESVVELHLSRNQAIPEVAVLDSRLIVHDHELRQLVVVGRNDREGSR